MLPQILPLFMGPCISHSWSLLNFDKLWPITAGSRGENGIETPCKFVFCVICQNLCLHSHDLEGKTVKQIMWNHFIYKKNMPLQSICQHIGIICVNNANPICQLGLQQDYVPLSRHHYGLAHDHRVKLFTLCCFQQNLMTRGEAALKVM